MEGNQSYRLDKEQLPNEKHITITGDIGMPEVGKFRQELINALGESRNIRISMKGLSDINPGFVQVLIALKNDSQRDVHLSLHLDSEQQAVLEHAGLTSFFDQIETLP
jgi:ABC-type transporter Mla MlaB component